MNRDKIEIVDYLNRKKCELGFSYNVIEDLKFGDMSTLRFKVPYYQYTQTGEVLRDNNNNRILNYNLAFIQNELICRYNDNLYLIKDVSQVKGADNSKYIEVFAKEKSVELSYKNIAYLDMSPPIFNPVKGNAAIINVLTSKFELDSGLVQSSTSNTIQLSSSASSTNSEYDGKKICIYDGTGQGYDYRITSYDGSTKTATISPNLVESLDGTSIYRVHYSKWTVGNIESQFLNDGTNDIFRTYKFEDITITQCLLDISETLDGYLSYSFEYDDTYNEYINKVNLVAPNIYSGVEIRYRKNLESISKHTDTNENIYTRVYPYGRDNLSINNVASTTRTDSGVTYFDHELGLSYIENYQYYLNQGYDIDFCRENFVNDYELNNLDYVDEQDLFDDAKTSLNKLSQPKITYKVKAIDLSELTGFNYEFFTIGDTIRIVDEEFGINVDATVVNKPRNRDKPEETMLELSNFVDNLGDYFSRVVLNNNLYTSINKVYGKSTTIVLADKETSKNWRYADYFIPEGETANQHIEKIANSLPTKGGKIVLLDGTYKIEYGLNISIDNIRIEGQGNSTILELYKGDNSQDQVPIFKFSSASRIGLSGLKIDGRANTITETYSKVGVEFDGCTDCVISNISIENVFSRGLKLTGVENVNIDNLLIDNVTGESVGTDNDEDVGLYILFSSAVIVNSFNINDTNLAIYESANSSNNLFVDGNCFTNRWSALFTNGKNSKYKNITVDSGEEGIFAAGEGIFDGIEIYNCNYGAVFNTDNSRLSNSLIHDNNVGVWVYLASYSEVFNNKIYNNNSYGLDLQSFFAICSSNYIYNNSQTSSVPSVVIRNSGCKFDNNRVKDDDGNSSVALLIESGVNDTVLIGNDLLNDTVPSLTDNGTNTQKFANIT